MPSLLSTVIQRKRLPLNFPSSLMRSQLTLGWLRMLLRSFRSITFPITSSQVPKRLFAHHLCNASNHPRVSSFQRQRSSGPSHPLATLTSNRYVESSLLKTTCGVAVFCRVSADANRTSNRTASATKVNKSLALQSLFSCTRTRWFCQTKTGQSSRSKKQNTS